MKVIKKDGSIDDFNFSKIKVAVQKSADRVPIKLTENDFNKLRKLINTSIGEQNINVNDLHEVVQECLSHIDNNVYKEYMSFRDYKKRFVSMLEGVIKNSKRIIYVGDKENANKNSTLVSTKKGLVLTELSKSIMSEYELPKDIADAHKNMDIYIHDEGDRFFDAINCCLFDMGGLLNGGFRLNGVNYTEPTSAESFMRVFSDIVLEASSQQYGGFTVPEIDTIGAKYVRMAIEKSIKYYTKELGNSVSKEKIYDLADKYVERALDQGFQAVETRLNTISNSNTQTPFVTFSFGLDTTKEGRMVSHAILNNRIQGIGRQNITPVFPKLVFLHRNEINGVNGSPNYDLYLKSIKCISTRMYPDMLSLNSGYLGDVFDKYRLPISPMGCRAYLSPWYVNGGMSPHDEHDYPIFTGRANCGAVTLNTVRYAIQSKGDKDEYFRLLTENFDLATRVHLWTYDRLCKVKASTNPLFFCEGGCHIKLKPDESIKRAIDTFTWSYGYIGLDEASLLMTGKHIHEDNSFATDVLQHLNKLVDYAKKEHGLLFAIYATPAEGLAYKLRNKDKELFGDIAYINDKLYYTNSFHCDVNAKISPIAKQDLEYPMFHLSNGGHIFYNELPISNNLNAIQTLVDEGMRRGFYMGVNLELDNCNNCGENGEFKDNICPSCGSSNITSVCRVCGYLSYSKIDGDTRLNNGKNDEVKNHRTDHTDIEVEI